MNIAIFLALAWLIWEVNKKTRKVIMNQAELAAALAALTAQESKIAKEQSDRFDVVTKALADLQASIGNADVTPEVTAALGTLQASVQALDDVIPDAPVVPSAP